MLEVEIKFKVDDFAVSETLNKIKEIFQFDYECREIDVYFNSEWHQYEKRGEALRLREIQRANEPARSVITYKGKKLSQESKAREEIELDITELQDWRLLLSRLHFHEVATIEKRRQYFSAEQMTVTVDEISGIGCFVEIEKMADAADLHSSENEIKLLAQAIGLTEIEPLSYLELWLNAHEN